MITQVVNIKALSVNECYTGKRYATKELKAFKKELAHSLKAGKVTYDKIKLTIVWYLSNPNADCSNPIKAFEDVLQKKYGFNDNRVYHIEASKRIVPKGLEKIYFQISEYEERGI